MMPNGLLFFDEETLVFGNMGNTFNGGSKKGGLYFLNITPSKEPLGKRMKLIKGGLGMVDGIEKSPAGNFFVSEFSEGKFYEISPNGETTTLLNNIKGAADFTLIDNKRMLLLPSLKSGKLDAYNY